MISMKRPDTINYIKLMNWIWETIPFIEGCKAFHLVLFIAIVDSINRNKWQKTKLPYEYLINKCKINKRTYLKARQWLIDHELVEMNSGLKGYQMAEFALGREVYKCTSSCTTDGATDRQNVNGNEVHKCTSPCTHSKTVNKSIKTLNIVFEEFWGLYDKKVGKEKSAQLWQRLTDEERQQAIDHIPKYVLATPEVKYRKDPTTYLRNKSFNDQIINHGRTSEKKLPERTDAEFAESSF